MSDVNTECGLRIAESMEDSLTDFPALPTETEIYILPDGEIVVADLPVELVPLLKELQKFARLDVEQVS